MAPRDDEEEQLRSVGLQNAQSILLARQRAEEALRKQSEWLRITLASIGDAVISTDAEGRVTFMNGVAEALTGWPQAEAVGRPLPDVFHIVNERTRQPVENPALRALRGGQDRGPGEPHHPDRPRRDGTAHRRQRRPHAGRGRGHRSGRSWSSATSPSASGPRRSGRGWPPSSSRPRTRSSARRSTASSARGTPGPSGSSATRPRRPWAGPSP